jgi:DNA polymerase I-like protein with 3'-5' exonuclease and polymerase domains
VRYTPVEGQLRLFEPSSDWRPHVGPLPMLTNVTIGIDTETRDGGLAREVGPGWVYKDGYILGVSVAWEHGAIYVPVTHPDTPANRPMEEVVAWVDHLMAHCHCVFFNGGYDVGWLIAEGCRGWPERMDDAQAQAIMLDENHDVYSLDTCCARAGVPGKDEQLLREAAAAYGVAPVGGSIKHGLWRLPAKHVGPYAEQDAIATLSLFQKQKLFLEQEGTTDAYRTEIALMPVVHGMRQRGIRVSQSAAEVAQRRIRATVAGTLSSISTPPIWHRAATIDDLRSPMRLAEIFDAEGIRYPRTPKTGQPSFTKDFMTKCANPVAKQVMRARQLTDLADKFIGQYIMEHTYRGRIHAEIHQLRDESGGARTNRLSYSNPPLQQMPSRDPELAPIVRGVFLPEEGTDWLAVDMANQEPRLLVHFAYVSRSAAVKRGMPINGSERFVDHFRNDPNPDIHQFTANILGLSRKATKDITQALSYRAGYKKLAFVMNISEDRAKVLWTTFHDGIPHIQGLSRFAEKLAQERGYIRMIDGARRHFPLWNPKYNRDEGSALRLEVAQAKWPGVALERAFTYQAVNSLIQGSAARQIKKSLVDCHRAGYLPIVSLHDENDFCVTSARECEEISQIMCDAVKLVIPVTVDAEIGPDWGTAKTDYREWFKIKRDAA